MVRSTLSAEACSCSGALDSLNWLKDREFLECRLQSANRSMIAFTVNEPCCLLTIEFGSSHYSTIIGRKS